MKYSIVGLTLFLFACEGLIYSQQVIERTEPIISNELILREEDYDEEKYITHDRFHKTMKSTSRPTLNL
jgi:hypothetical protein